MFVVWLSPTEVCTYTGTNTMLVTGALVSLLFAPAAATKTTTTTTTTTVYD